MGESKEAAMSEEAQEAVPEEVIEQPEAEPEVETPPEEVEEEGEVIITLGDESPPSEEVEQQSAPEWVKELRKQNRELKRILKEKEQAPVVVEHKPTEPGQKPTLESVDFDAELFEQKLEEWHEKKRQFEEEQRKAKEALEAANREWQKELDRYNGDKAKLKVPDFDDAEEVVKETLSTVHQSIVVKYAKDPAKVVYALGKHPKKAKELAAIADPIAFAFAIRDLEMNELKVTKRNSAPPPEKEIRGSGTPSGAVDQTLERLRAEAERTGDYSKVMAYKRQKK